MATLLVRLTLVGVLLLRHCLEWPTCLLGERLCRAEGGLWRQRSVLIPPAAPRPVDLPAQPAVSLFLCSKFPAMPGVAPFCPGKFSLGWLLVRGEASSRVRVPILIPQHLRGACPCSSAPFTQDSREHCRLRPKSPSCLEIYSILIFMKIVCFFGPVNPENSTMQAASGSCSE